MFNKWTIISSTLLALSTAYTVKTKVEAIKAARMFLDAAHEFEETQIANEAQIQYLCHVLEKHEVPVDEFDLIVLNYNM